MHTGSNTTNGTDAASRCVFIDRREGQTVLINGVQVTLKAVGKNKVRLACVGPRTASITYDKNSKDEKSG